MSDDMSGDEPVPQPDAPLPKPRDLEKAVRPSAGGVAKAGARYARDIDRESTIAGVEYTHLAGLRDHYRHKKRWSNFLIGLMASMVGFQSVLLAFVGFGWWDFSKYEWLLPALLVQNLGQVIGLALFVVKSLFKDMKWD